MSTSDISSDVSATMLTREVEASGWSIAGAFETCGSACACVMRSATTWRARRTSVPGSNTSTMEESPAIDSDWIESSQATPLRRSASSGTVMSSSTSSAESPRASV